MKDYDNLILVTPTYGVGELQPHWQKQYETLSKMDFHGKVVGLIGLGNQFAFGESFVGALRVLYDVIIKNGGKVVGFVSDKEYSHEETTSVIDGNFVGLPIDEINQGSKTPQRIISWLEVVKKNEIDEKSICIKTDALFYFVSSFNVLSIFLAFLSISFKRNSKEFNNQN